MYVDGIPGHLLNELENLEKEIKDKKKNVIVYVVINNGYYDARQNHIAASMVRIWCKKTNLQFGQAILIGGGPMMNKAPLEKWPTKKHKRNLDKFIDAIQNKQIGTNIESELDVPRWIYLRLAHMSWRMEAKHNGLKSKDIRRMLE